MVALDHDRVTRLLCQRRAAWAELGSCWGPLRDMRPVLRARADRASADFRRADREILQAVKAAAGALAVNGRLLRETADGLDWAECDPDTGLPVDAPSVRDNRRGVPRLKPLPYDRRPP